MNSPFQRFQDRFSLGKSYRGSFHVASAEDHRTFQVSNADAPVTARRFSITSVSVGTAGVPPSARGSVRSWGLARTLDVEEGGFERVCGSGVETMVGGQKHDIRRPRSSGIKIIFLSSPSRPPSRSRSRRVHPSPPAAAHLFSTANPSAIHAGARDGEERWRIFRHAAGFNWIHRR